MEWVLLIAFTIVIISSAFIRAKLKLKNKFYLTLISGLILILLLLFGSDPSFSFWKLIIMVVIVSSGFRDFKKMKKKQVFD